MDKQWENHYLVDKIHVHITIHHYGEQFYEINQRLFSHSGLLLLLNKIVI
jgi:hypothetical protein